jgi:hypothetical protein
LAGFVSAVLLGCSVWVYPWWWDEPWHGVDHFDLPAVVVHDVVVMGAEQA